MVSGSLNYMVRDAVNFSEGLTELAEKTIELRDSQVQ